MKMLQKKKKKKHIEFPQGFKSIRRENQIKSFPRHQSGTVVEPQGF